MGFGRIQKTTFGNGKRRKEIISVPVSLPFACPMRQPVTKAKSTNPLYQIFCKFVYKLRAMTATAIRQKLYEYIRFADDKKVKAIYTIVADEANDISEWWEDKKLLEKVKRADADMESGKDKGVTWQEAKKQLLKRGK